MWRYCYTIIRNIFRIPEAVKTMTDMIELSKKRPVEFNKETKYRYVQYICDVMQKTGNIKTEVYGEENLPKNGGYMMYPNHQGKYDVYISGIARENKSLPTGLVPIGFCFISVDSIKFSCSVISWLTFILPLYPRYFSISKN